MDEVEFPRDTIPAPEPKRDSGFENGFLAGLLIASFAWGMLWAFSAEPVKEEWREQCAAKVLRALKLGE